MDISDLIGPQHVALDVRARDKGSLLRELGRRAAPFVGVDADAITSALAERERLGSTGLGRGFALPHARMREVTRLFGTFLRLARPIEFQAIDERPVDLVFLLLIPADTGAITSPPSPRSRGGFATRAPPSGSGGRRAPRWPTRF